MKHIPVCMVLSLLATGSGCSQPISIELSNACDLHNEKKYVQVSGFLDDDGSVFCSNIGGRMHCDFVLTETPGGAKKMGVALDQGNAANAVEKLVSGYTRGDIKIHDNNESIISLENKVSLTGRMSVATDVCSITVDKIEK